MTTLNQSNLVSDQVTVPALTEQKEEALPVKKVDARTRILKTALTEFATRGFDGVSTTEIAKAAGVTQPLIHYHFKSKETLWKASVEQVFGWLKDDFSEIFNRTPTDKRLLLKELVRMLVEFSGRHPEAGQFLLREGTQQTERLNWMIDNLMQPAIDMLSVRHHQAVDEGWLKNIPFAQLSVIITAVSTHFFALAPMVQRCYGINPTDVDQIEILADIAVGIIDNLTVDKSQTKNVEEEAVETA